ncbi:TPA: hypothetical protein I8167_004335 [Raoultella ornithinolytica]|nr:hypothetical protein [Raoultella ornithinolytica]HAT2558615.1 hypothetical protein [Raoultella ornithinolytica]HAZ3452454.1 hypothetical protein [Raoultella ornithinolytica]
MQQNNQQTCNTGDKTSCLSFSHGPDDCPRQDVTFVLRRRWVGVKLLAPFIMSAMSFRHRSVYLIYFCSGDIISLLRRGPGSLNPDIRFIRNHETPFRDCLNKCAIHIEAI